MDEGIRRSRWNDCTPVASVKAASALTYSVSRNRAPIQHPEHTSCAPTVCRAQLKGIRQKHSNTASGALLTFWSSSWYLQIYSSKVSKVINCAKIWFKSLRSFFFIKKTLFRGRLWQIKNVKKDNNFHQRRKLHLSLRVTLLLLWGVPCSCLQILH